MALSHLEMHLDYTLIKILASRYRFLTMANPLKLSKVISKEVHKFKMAAKMGVAQVNAGNSQMALSNFRMHLESK